MILAIYKLQIQIQPLPFAYQYPLSCHHHCHFYFLAISTHLLTCSTPYLQRLQQDSPPGTLAHLAALSKPGARISNLDGLLNPTHKKLTMISYFTVFVLVGTQMYVN